MSPAETCPFAFRARWKEELVCTCSVGALVLEHPMGKPKVLLPTRDRWLTTCPSWAAPHWDALQGQLRAWCAAANYDFQVDETASVSFDDGKTWRVGTPP